MSEAALVSNFLGCYIWSEHSAAGKQESVNMQSQPHWFLKVWRQIMFFVPYNRLSTICPKLAGLQQMWPVTGLSQYYTTAFWRKTRLKEEISRLIQHQRILVLDTKASTIVKVTERELSKLNVQSRTAYKITTLKSNNEQFIYHNSKMDCPPKRTHPWSGVEGIRQLILILKTLWMFFCFWKNTKLIRVI